MAQRHPPFDAVLLIAFGGPTRRADIRPFLRNVLRQRRVPPARLEAVVAHYERFDGVSPLTAITERQASGLRDRLAAAGTRLPVYVGMRNWHPFLDDTLAAMATAGVRRALGFILAAHHSYSSCAQYRQNVADAREALRRRGAQDIHVVYAAGWHDHPGFVAANAGRVEVARRRLPAAVRGVARLVFTAHSIPTRMAAESRYAEEIRDSARLVAEAAGASDWAVAFQSRSGRPQDPWLGPDIGDYLRAERSRGLRAVVICPLGFVADHIEVLYDLDIEAATLCAQLDLPMTRAAAVNDDPAFLDMMADVVRRAVAQAERGQPLPIVPATPPAMLEGPPAAR